MVWSDLDKAMVKKDKIWMNLFILENGNVGNLTNFKGFIQNARKE